MTDWMNLEKKYRRNFLLWATMTESYQVIISRRLRQSDCLCMILDIVQQK